MPSATARSIGRSGIRSFPMPYCVPVRVTAPGARAARVARRRRRRRKSACDALLRGCPRARSPSAREGQRAALRASPPSSRRPVLGPRRKYSGCLWGPGTATLAAGRGGDARAHLRARPGADGMRILDLGCGWGSLSLWLAERYPTPASPASPTRPPARVDRGGSATGAASPTSRSSPRMSIDFEPAGRFDRVISVEMFEHMRNWRELLRRVSTWLSADGKAFVHVFSHRMHPTCFGAHGRPSGSSPPA